MNDERRLPEAPSETPAKKSIPSIPDRRLRESDFASGYRLGHFTGWEVGYRHAQHEQTRAYLAEIEARPELAATRGPSLSALQAIRQTLPEQSTCTCPTCELRRDAVRRNGGDYLGGPVAWERAS